MTAIATRAALATPHTATSIPRFSVLTGAVRLIDPVRLPALPGSELRGLLTQGLVRIGRLRPDAISPFTLTPDWPANTRPDRLIDHPAGEALPFTVLWFDDDPDPAGLIQAAFGAIGWEPLLGRGRRGRFTAQIERALAADALPAAIEARVTALAQSDALTLRALTPLALRERGEMRATLGDGRALLVSIRHRAERLSTRFDPLDAPGLSARCDAVGFRLERTNMVRYRRRGRARQYTPITGLLGEAHLDRPAPATLRALVVGELLRAGRWTAFGAGRYALAPAPHPATASRGS